MSTSTVPSTTLPTLSVTTTDSDSPPTTPRAEESNVTPCSHPLSPARSVNKCFGADHRVYGYVKMSFEEFALKHNLSIGARGKFFDEKMGPMPKIGGIIPVKRLNGRIPHYSRTVPGTDNKLSMATFLGCEYGEYFILSCKVSRTSNRGKVKKSWGLRYKRTKNGTVLHYNLGKNSKAEATMEDGTVEEYLVDDFIVREKQVHSDYTWFKFFDKHNRLVMIIDTNGVLTF